VPKYSANILWWNFEAWECMMQGVQLFRHFTKDDNSKARVLFRKALDLDPNYAMGFVWLAWTYWSDARFHWADAADDALTHPGQGLRAFCERRRKGRRALLSVVLALVETLDRCGHVGDEPDAIAPALALQDPHRLVGF
jgi:hypothetical protein